MQVQIKTTPQLEYLGIRRIDLLIENLTDGFDWESLAPMVAEAAADRIFRITKDAAGGHNSALRMLDGRSK